jgi:septum formation protein
MATTKRLILASGSEGRRWLLEKAGFSFEVIPSGVDEPDGKGVSDPRTFVAQLAWLKARAVAPRVSEGWIVAADSVGWHDDEVIGKPLDRDDARRILLSLGGTVHELWSGVCVWLRPSDRQVCWQEVSRVRMKAWTEPDLQMYLESGVWEGKSGAYGIQEENDPFLDVVQGTTSNVIGLPMESLTDVLESTQFFDAK